MPPKEELLTSLKLVQLNDLIQTVAEEAYKGLQSLAASLSGQDDESKKRAILQHLHATRQRLQRLDVLLQWCHKAPAVAECSRVMQVASSHAAALRDAADQLAYLHGELAAGQAPPYDVPTAFHVLRRGGGHLLPTIIEDELGPKPSATGPNDEGTDGASAVQDAALLRRWDFLLRCKLLEEGLPEGVRVESIGGGTVTLYSADGAYYKAHLAIVPAPGKEVTLAKWGDTPSTVQEAGEGEVEQAVPTEPDGGHENAAMDVDGTVEAASNEGAKPSSEAFHWRWRLMSFELLPGLSPPVLSPLLAQWLQRNVEDRMWAAGDIQQLTSLGKAHLVIVPPAPLSKEERDRRQAERDEIKKGLGPKDRSKLTGAGTSAARTSSAAGGGGVSSGPGPSSAGGPPGSSSLAPGSNGTDMPVPGDIPAWAASPLAAMHAVLLNAASKLAVGQLLLEEARGMEEGSWAGHLRASRAPQGAGLRLLVWPQVPLLTRTELAKLKGEEPLEPHLSDADSKHQPPCGCAVDVLLGKDGYITCTRLPNPSTLPLQPFSPGGGIAAERLVTATALDCAALQLAGIQAVLLEDDSLRQELGATWMADLDTGAAPEGMDGNVPTTLAQPVLRLGVGGDTCATVQINPKTGAPVLCLGHSLAEDGTVVDRARSIVQLAQQALTQGIEDARVGPLEKDVSRGTACVSAAARSIGAALKELAFERRKAACASAAFAAGFLRTPLPAILQSPQPPAGEKYDSVATLALGVPRFPSPLGLPEQMPVADRGSLLGLLLIDMSTLPPAAAAIRCGLALLTATPRGIPAGLHSVVQLPEKLLAVKVSAEAPAPSSRKRKGRESESVPLESKPLYDASNGKTATAAQGHLLDLDWGGIMTCSLELLAQEQLNAQIKALGLSLAESKAGHEFTLKDVPGLQKALLDLEAAEEGRELKGYAVTIKLDPSVPARGLFAVALPEPGKAPRESEGLLMNGDARRDDTLKGTVTYGAVPVLGYALAEGHCVADAIIDVVSYLKAQTLLAKLATALEGVEDLGVKRQSRVKPERLGHAAFKFTVAVPDGKDADVAPVEVTLTWGPGASSAAKDGENGADLLTVGCKVAAQPALPAVMLSSLASIADGNDVELLLDVIGHLAAPAAVLQAAALEPAAQYAAGLMPGALNVERCTLVTQDNPDGSLPLGTSDGVKQRSPGCLQCLMLVRQLGRALQLGVWISSESIIMRIRHIPPIPAFPEGASWLAAALGRAREGTGCQERLETDEAGTHAVFEINASELAVVLKVMLEAVAGKDA